MEEGLHFPGINAGIMASFQAAMENIAKARLRETFARAGLNYETLLKAKEEKACYPSDIRGSSVCPARQSATSHNKLSMGIVGCLPDNVQKATRSFSIKPGKQHFTIAFPFMSDMIRSCPTDGDLQSSDPTNQITEALYVDVGPEVISGFRSISTMMVNKERTSMVVVLLTLFEVNSIEGILRHFDSMVRMMVQPNTPITLWKHPLCVLDLDAQIKEAIYNTSAETILEIQHENIQNSFPGKSRQDLHIYLKDRIIASRFSSYSQHYYRTSKLLSSFTSAPNSSHILTMLEHLRSGRCSTADFHKMDAYLKASHSPHVKTFWLVWGHEQLAGKIFPMAEMASRPGYFQMSSEGASTSLLDTRHDRLSVPHVSIKEGLKNIIESLKQQESISSHVMLSHLDRSTPCSWYPDDKASPVTASSFLDKRSREQSAFYRPRTDRRIRHSSTPYSDALKAVAVSPFRQNNCRKVISYSKNDSYLQLRKEQSSLLDRKNCFTQKMPHLHTLYCDFFGAKIKTSACTEPSSTSTL